VLLLLGCGVDGDAAVGGSCSGCWDAPWLSGWEVLVVLVLVVLVLVLLLLLGWKLRAGEGD